MNLVKKATIQKRLEARLAKVVERIEALQKEELALFPKMIDYYAKMAVLYEERAKALRAAISSGEIKSSEDWHRLINKTPILQDWELSNQKPDFYGFDNKLHFLEKDKKMIERNMRILEALDGDTIEVSQLKTGKEFTLETIFGDDF